MSFLSKDVGIDLGTANTLVYMKGKGIIMREPSVVAVDTKTDEVRCVGTEAKAVIGRTPGSIVAVRPLKDGVIADFDITANLLENFLKKACGNSMFSRPRVVICIPSGVTEVERRAVREATLKAGARQVSVIEEPMAAAIGAGLPIGAPTGSMIVGIGGGRIMDQAKATAHFAGDLPIVEVPTSIATCAAFAPLSVMYTAEGASLGSLRYDHEVNAIVMDMDVICKEPPRYAASGIMDGMAKMIEIQNGRSEILLDDVSIGLFTAYTIAEMAYHVYEKEAHQACHDIAEGKLTKAVEDIAYLNVAVAGIVSGVSKGFGQTALGHETYELVRTHFTQEAKPYLHGEIVAIGDCLQLAFNGHPEQVAPFRDFMRSMNMPLTLEDIGIDPNSPKMENLFQDLFHSPFMEPTAENEARLRKAMHYLSAD